MKKILTLIGGALLAMQSLTATAENRKWDFRNWSPATVANLKAGADWSDIEKATDIDKGPTDLSRDNCFWEVTASGTAEGTTLTANGEVIAELNGLLYTNTTSRSLAIAVNYGDVSSLSGSGFGPYQGASYLWLGSKTKNYFIIPGVKAGAKIKMGVESHNTTKARGVNLYVGHGTSGTKLKSPAGEDVSVPKTYTEQEWEVPVDLKDAPNADGTYDIQIQNTDGCHLYYIEVVEDMPELENARLAYIYSSAMGNASEEPYYDVLMNNENFKNVTIEFIDATQAIDALALRQYNVVVVSPMLSGSEVGLEAVKSSIAYVPMLNLNPNLYKAWELGDVISTATNIINIPEVFREHDLFKPSSSSDNYIDENGNLVFFEDGGVTGVTIPEGTYFADDRVLATAGDAVISHIHNPSRNAYMLLSYGAENTSFAGSFVDLMGNAVKILNSSKQDVTLAATPVFTYSFKNLSTDVSISCSTKGAEIYYTTDGSEPTSASTLYTEPFNISSENTVVKAIAYANGYDASLVGDSVVAIYTTTASPIFSVEQQEGKTVVTLSTTEEDAIIYYNIAGSNKANESTIYTEPIEIKNYTTLTAFTGELGDKKQSECITKDIFVQGKEIRIDVVSHFDANRADWSNGESKTFYYTEGKKNGYPFYNTHEETGKASDGVTDSTYIVVDGPANKLTLWNPGKGWEFKSYGQGALWENNGPVADVDNSNDAKRYRGETALDFGASSYNIQFGNPYKSDGVHGDPYSCSIESTEAFQGPFDVVTFVGNGSSNNLPRADIYVSTDTTDVNNWTKVDSVTFSKNYRYIKKSVIGYEGTEKVFVKLQADFSSVMVFDIIIMNNGEKSQGVNGIEEITDSKEACGEIVRTEIYSINGVKTSRAAKGINIVKEVYANGTVKTRKVMVK